MVYNCSNCIYAGEKNSLGLLWCNKKKVYISGEEIDECKEFKNKKDDGG